MSAGGPDHSFALTTPGATCPRRSASGGSASPQRELDAHVGFRGSRIRAVPVAKPNSGLDAGEWPLIASCPPGINNPLLVQYILALGEIDRAGILCASDSSQ